MKREIQCGKKSTEHFSFYALEMDKLHYYFKYWKDF